ncbi:MAG: hypothetical protein WCJ39_00990 [bacterium]
MFAVLVVLATLMLIFVQNTFVLAIGSLTSCIGDEVPLLLVLVVPFSVAKIILFPLLGGVLQTPFVAASTICGSYSIPCFVPGVEVGVEGQEYAHQGGVAKTIQFPAISLNGFGSFIPKEYGQTHIANPIPRVMVGAI